MWSCSICCRVSCCLETRLRTLGTVAEPSLQIPNTSRLAAFPSSS